ncbi:hypothetical protein ACFTWF_39805 [Rhodococcus sp. NPDC056960]|uniref:hypothetical protein n=1 Tax=Rhodococcus sp. NPDC056960 TaxID=3345982 RepID=UPI0036268DF2
MPTMCPRRPERSRFHAHTTPRSFGSLRRLLSGKWQARYSTPDGSRHAAPHTFDTRRAADDWLSDTRAAMLRGRWVDPAAASITFGRYAREWIATRDLSPRTRDLYEYQLSRWADVDLTDPTGGTIHLAALDVGRLDLPTIRRWFAHPGPSRAAHVRPVGSLIRPDNYNR